MSSRLAPPLALVLMFTDACLPYVFFHNIRILLIVLAWCSCACIVSGEPGTSLAPSPKLTRPPCPRE